MRVRIVVSLPPMPAAARIHHINVAPCAAAARAVSARRIAGAADK